MEENAPPDVEDVARCAMFFTTGWYYDEGSDGLSEGVQRAYAKVTFDETAHLVVLL